MTRRDFIEEYYNEVGEYPDEQIISDMMEFTFDKNYESIKYNNYNKASNSSQHYNNISLEKSTNKLLDEVKDIFTTIASNSKISSKEKMFFTDLEEYKAEFIFMVLIFLAKSSLYFLLKDSYSKGYDFSNL